MYGESGHLLGNHSHFHQRPHELGSEEYVRGIAIAHDSLKALTGFVKWYRHPFLDEGRTVGLRDSLRAALDSLDYMNGYVTVDNYDWHLDRCFQEAVKSGREVDYDRLRGLYVDVIWDAILFYDEIGREELGRSPKHILLLHENDLAALCIDTLVGHIRGHGWKIISPRDAYSDPVADIATETLFNNQGRIAAIAAAHGIKPMRLIHPAEDVNFLDSLIDAAEVFR
jgi:peptidoglycan/xylan/chitin deacetylase (PgdA/CDA1 family)